MRKMALASFVADTAVFGAFRFRQEFVENMLRNYAYLNRGLSLQYNGRKFKSDRGLHDLLENKLDGPHSTQ